MKNPMCCNQESKFVTISHSINYHFCEVCRKEVKNEVGATSTQILKPNLDRSTQIVYDVGIGTLATYLKTNVSWEARPSVKALDYYASLGSQIWPTKELNTAWEIAFGVPYKRTRVEILRDSVAKRLKTGLSKMMPLDSNKVSKHYFPDTVEISLRAPVEIPREEVENAVIDRMRTLNCFSLSVHIMHEQNSTIADGNAFFTKFLGAEYV